MAMDAAKIGTFDWDMKTGQVVWSENLELLAGLAPGGFGGTRESFVQLVHPEDRGRVQQAVEKAVRTRSEYGVEFRMIWPNGTQRWLQARGRPYFNDAGQPARMVGIDMDITDQKLTEQQLLIAEEKYSDFYNNAPDLLFSLDAKTGRILECNQTARDILGFSKKRDYRAADLRVLSPRQPGTRPSYLAGIFGDRVGAQC
jgi:PAS domain S-box-containing protein